MKKRLVVLLTALFVVCCLFGCSGKTKKEEITNANSDESQKETATPKVEETQKGSTASKEEKQTKSEIAIMVVSFGTSYNDSRDITIGAIENAITKAFPEYEVRRAFTSQIIIDKLKERDGLEIDNIEEALERAAADGIKALLVQPTHLMNGYEYNDLAKALTEYKEKFDKIILAEPLLMSDADFDAVMKAVTKKTSSYDNGETAICFMGHGTQADSNAVYAKMQEKLTQAGYENYYIGTVEATPSLDDVIAALKAKGTYKKVVIEPLMVVAGDHANNDMAGEEDSWKTRLEKEGFEVECIIEGIGQIPEIQEIYVDHAKAALSAGKSFTGVDVTEKANTQSAKNITDGTYSVEVESSSSMFKIEKAELTVVDGTMNAVITLGGTGYTKLYMGTEEQAAKAEEADYISFVEDANGAYTFAVPVAALDQVIDCAAYSKKKEEWYDRKITFLSNSLTLANTTSDNTKIEAAGNTETAKAASKEETKIEDGTYTIEVELKGGSGKTTIASPATIKVAGNQVVACIQWSSPNYDYMLVNGEKYLPVNTEGDSVFEIPVLTFDEEIPVIGDTIAMSKPREIEYTLIFDSNTMKAVN